MNNKFYITTAIDYTNELIHIGHLYQKIIADVYARYHRLVGDKVFFLTGTDEHGSKAEKAAAEAGLAGQEKQFVDRIAQADQKEQEALEISFDRFLRTTDPDHIKFVTKFWQQVKQAGDIYLGEYEGFYCEGCEAYLTKSDLTDGRCPFHPYQIPKSVKEKNYFFRLSKYAKFLKNHYRKHPDFVWPKTRRNEMLSFIKQGLQDVPVSRSKIKWGIAVPDDPGQTIYVWFDALLNYLSGAAGFWPADIHVLGKDNTRFHALLWPAMLKSAGYQLPKTILVNGFVTLNGQKISKSLGNVIRGSELAAKFGADAVRYYLLKIKPIDTDGNIALDKIKEIYNADLANGLGNLVSRIARLAEKSTSRFFSLPSLKISSKVSREIENFHPENALLAIWQEIAKENRRINKEKPWELKGQVLEKFLTKSVDTIRQTAYNLQPFMPATAKKILNQFKGPEITSETPLFPRLS